MVPATPMLESRERSANLLTMLKAYCAELKRNGGHQSFWWEETTGVHTDGHAPHGVPESKDHRWRLVVADTLRAEGFTYVPNAEGFTLYYP